MVKFELITGDPRAQICALRRCAYGAKYPKESLNLELLQWNKVDEVSMHFGAFHSYSGDLLSTLRLTVSDSPELFQKVLLLPFQSEMGTMPYAILSRAATDPTRQGSKINFSLRSFVLNFIFSNNLSEQVFGLVADNASRISALEEMGYTKTLNPNPWKGCLSRPAGKSFLLRLAKKNFYRNDDRVAL